MITTVNRLAKISGVLILIAFLVACGTVKGFGQDVSKAGQDIQQAAS